MILHVLFEANIISTLGCNTSRVWMPRSSGMLNIVTNEKCEDICLHCIGSRRPNISIGCGLMFWTANWCWLSLLCTKNLEISLDPPQLTTLFRQLVGSVLWIARHVHPDATCCLPGSVLHLSRTRSFSRGPVCSQVSQRCERSQIDFQGWFSLSYLIWSR